MRTPPGLQALIDDGVIDEVLRPLKSGKEAAVYVVRSGGEVRCAKVYKDMAQRSFQQRVQYQEGRKVRGSREARAIGKATKYGRKQQETAWKNTEVDALYQLRDAGVRVPEPYGYFHGVLVMELVVDGDGHSAPRLGEVELSPEQARGFHRFLVRQVVKMLCVGLIHGDLSEYNVLVAPDGPVIIDFPQVVSAAGNNAARAMLLRACDVRLPARLTEAELDSLGQAQGVAKLSRADLAACLATGGTGAGRSSETKSSKSSAAWKFL